MEIKDAFNQNGLGLKQEIIVAEHAVVEKNKESSIFDMIKELFTNKLFLILLLAILLLSYPTLTGMLTDVLSKL